MMYAVETGSGATLHILSFIKIGSAIQKLTGGEVHIQHADGTSLLSNFF
jgi:hypothetical protein